MWTFPFRWILKADTRKARRCEGKCCPDHQTGAVGVNFEDQKVQGSGLYSIDEQCARISAFRKAADEAGIPFFINARTDLFLQESDAAKT